MTGATDPFYTDFSILYGQSRRQINRDFSAKTKNLYLLTHWGREIRMICRSNVQWMMYKQCSEAR